MDAAPLWKPLTLYLLALKTEAACETWPGNDLSSYTELETPKRLGAALRSDPTIWAGEKASLYTGWKRFRLLLQ